VGIRVTDLDRALRFYEKLGFRLTLRLPEYSAVEMENESGVGINLIHNAIPREDGRNILLDEPEKFPGVTHPAFVVANLDDTVAQLHAQGIGLSEGPLDLDRRRICFVRDPDGTVIEFDEML
jgi:lactoylglutathione lyase